MEFDDAVSARRTVRDFDPRPVDQAIVRAAVEAAFKAPTYDHLRRWEFIFLEDRRSRLAALDADGVEDLEIDASEARFKGMDEAAAGMYVDANSKQRRMVLEAPRAVIVAFGTKKPVGRAERISDVNCVSAAWCCIENFMLALASRGVLGVTQVLGNTIAVKAALGIPDGYEIAALISFGYPSATAAYPRQKEIRIEDHVHVDTWRGGHE